MNVSKTRRLVVIITMVVASMFLVICSTNEVNEPLGISNFGQLELTTLSNSSGLEKTTFYTYEDIFLSIDGLIPLEQTKDARSARIRSNALSSSPIAMA